jgi:hypothetical protein
MVIFGVGTLGSHFALLAADTFRNECEYKIIDFDKVEKRNFRTQAYWPIYENKFKVEALQSLIWGKTGVLVDPWKTCVKSREHFTGYDLVVEVVDNPESIALTKGLNCPVLHLKFIIQDGKPVGSILWDEKYNFGGAAKNGVDPCDVEGMLAFAWVMAGHAVWVVNRFLTQGVKENRVITLNNVQIF